MSFGYVEFANVEGVLSCIRILNNITLLDKQLQITPNPKTQIFINEWKILKEKEWQLKENKEENSFEESLSQNDTVCLHVA